LLDGRNFRGSDDQTSEYDKGLRSTQIRYINADVLALRDVSKLKSEYDLILLDPPYGKTDQQWDKEAWSEEQFDIFFTSAMLLTTSKSFTIVSFLWSRTDFNHIESAAL
jgi:16S rRNA G966 N2-methylase RsmD